MILLLLQCCSLHDLQRLGSERDGMLLYCIVTSLPLQEGPIPAANTRPGLVAYLGIDAAGKTNPKLALMHMPAILATAHTKRSKEHHDAGSVMHLAPLYQLSKA
jgi:hypothetical protein